MQERKPDIGCVTSTRINPIIHYTMSLPKMKFSSWVMWADREELPGTDKSGVYLLAHFKRPCRSSASPKTKKIIYVGETTKQTLKKRLEDFHRAAFRGNTPRHSGGKTYHNQFGQKEKKDLFVAVFAPNVQDSLLREFYIRYLERKLLYDFVNKWKCKPICNIK
jgi:hypothetical protein